MLSCCIEGCESYKFTNKQKIGYFQFPLDNKLLLNKWLEQIRLPDWHPTDKDQICSTHFLADDIDFRPSTPTLNSKAVPLIFPIKHFDYIYSDSKTSVSKNHSEHEIERINVSSVKNAKNVSKTQMNSNSLSQKDNIKNDKLTAGTSNSKPYILIISDENQTKIPLNSKPSKKELGVLRIQIDKKINNAILSGSTKNSLTDENNSNHETNQRLCKDRPVEEVEIDDTLSSKKVVFKFDPTSGKITVTKKDKIEKDNEIPIENGNIEKSVTINENNSSNSHSLNESLSEKQIESQNNAGDSLKNKQNITEKEKNIIDIDKNIQNSNSARNKQRNQKKKLSESIITVDKEIKDTKTLKIPITSKDSESSQVNSTKTLKIPNSSKDSESLQVNSTKTLKIPITIKDSESSQVNTTKTLKTPISSKDSQPSQVNSTKSLNIPITSKDSQSSQVKTDSQTNKLHENGQKAQRKMDTKFSNNSSPNSYLCVVLNNISQKRKPDVTTNNSSTKNAKISKKI